MKNVLIITYYWPPSGGSGVQRWLKFVKYFPEFNVNPLVLTVKPEKASYPVIDNSLENEIPQGLKVYKTNTFEVFELYRKLIGKGKYPHSSFDSEADPSFLQKISRFVRGNLFLPDSRIGWKSYAVKEGKRIINKHNIDTIITTGPPHSAHLTGLKLKKMTGVNWIADFRDPWTDIFYYDAFYHTALAKRIDKRLERKVVEQCDRLTIVSQALKDLIKEKSDKINPAKIMVLHNGFDEQDFEIPSDPPEDKFLVTFTGSLMNDNEKMNVFVKALHDVVIKYKDVNIEFRFIGNINDSVQKLFAENGLEKNFEKISYVTHSEAVKYLMHSTACFSTIRRTANNKGIISGKIFDYLGSGKPIICLGPTDGNVSEVLNECEAGKVIDYEDFNGIKDYLAELIIKWKSSYNIDHRNKTYLDYSRKSLTEKISTIINKPG